MDLSPRGLARWLPTLTLALIVEAAVSVIFSFTISNWGILDMIRTLLHLPHVALLIGFGVAIRVLTAGGEYRVAAQRLLWVGFLAIAVTALTRFQDVYVFLWSAAARGALLLQGAGSALLGIAAPAIWGTAIAREEDLQDSRIGTAGRIYSIAALTGFGSYVVSEGLRLADHGFSGRPESPTAAAATFALLLLAARVALFWSTLLFWSAPADEIAARDRSRRVQALMLGWMVASSAALALSAIVGVFEWRSGGVANSLMLFWHAVVQATLTLIVTILVALSLEPPALDFEPRRKRTVLNDPVPPPAGDNSPIDLP